MLDMRTLLALVLLLLVAAAGAYWYAGRMPGPTIEIARPTRLVGQSGALDVSVTAPRGTLSRLDIAMEQNGKQYPLFALPGTDGATLKQESEDRVRVTRDVGRRSIKELRSGAARIVVTAERPVLFGVRRAVTQVTRDVLVRLEPPRVSVVSMHHFVNHGGAEAVVYRVNPPEAESGVRVGHLTYPGFPATGAGVAGADPTL